MTQPLNGSDDWDPQGYDNDTGEEELPPTVTIRENGETAELEETEEVPVVALAEEEEDPLALPDRLRELEDLEKQIDEPPLQLGTEEEEV